jgi:hypothetical protein
VAEHVQTNRSFIVAAIVAFAGFFAVDSFLFANEGFRHTLGDATQEGQVLSKVERAREQAELADVILFGSSYVRSGISGEPFLENGVLPFNFGVSGGAQVFDYFALERIAPILSARTTKPTLVVELKTDALLRTPDNAWSEYPQYIAIVRSRGEMVRHAPALLDNFRAFNMMSPFLSGLLIPSSIYRSHAVPVLGARAELQGTFYGPEDFSGYSALYTQATPAMVLSGREQPALLSDFYGAKIDFLKKFLQRATSTGSRVVLFQSPTMMMGRDARVLDLLFDVLAHQFPDAKIIRTSDYSLDVADFDEGRHPNIRGADKISRELIRLLGLRGSSEAVSNKIRAGFLQAGIPEFSKWTTAAGTTAGGLEISFEAADRAGAMIAESQPIPIEPGRDWVLEFATPQILGNAMVEISWHEPRTGRAKSVSTVSQLESPPWGTAARFFLRVRPTASTVTVRILDYGALAGRPLASGRLKLLRFWSNAA